MEMRMQSMRNGGVHDKSPVRPSTSPYLARCYRYVAGCINSQWRFGADELASGKPISVEVDVPGLRSVEEKHFDSLMTAADIRDILDRRARTSGLQVYSRTRFRLGINI